MKNKVCPTVEIPLAVEAVCSLEKLLIKFSKKRKLTAKHRQKLLKCAVYLRKQREAANSDQVILRQSLWIMVLRILAQVIEKSKHIKDVFDAVMGK